MANLAQRARHFADSGKRGSRNAVADAGSRIDGRSQPIGDGDGDALRFAGAVAEAKNERVLRRSENAGSLFDRLLERDRTTVDRGDRLGGRSFTHEPLAAK